MMSDTAKIHGAIAKVMADLGAIGKDRQNKEQGFMFRGIDQVYNALHPLMAKHKVFTVPRVVDVYARADRPTRSGGIITYTLLKMEYDFVSGEDGSKITVGPMLAEGADTGDKSSNKAMAIGHKYALFQLFLIPTEEGAADDPDLTIPEPVQAAPPPVKKVTPKPAPVVDDKLSTEITTEAEADNISAMIISLVENAKTKGGLQDLWKKNLGVIDYLDHKYHAQFERVKAAFTKVKQQMEKGS